MANKSIWPDDWREIPLEGCMSAIIDYRGKTPRKTSFGIPLVTAKIVKNGRIDTPREYIDPDDYDTWMRRGLPQPNDVVMTTEAPLGEVAQLESANVALAQRLITLRGKPRILDNKFLKFLMQSRFVQRQLSARASGTTVLGIKQSELRKVVLVIPPLSEQKAIAEILGALDDKVELNRRMNDTLESVARAIFKSWFVDFDPVRAKMDGRQPIGLSADTAALFPNSFVESELGHTPSGWEVRPVSEVVDVNPTRRISKGRMARYLDMKNMPLRGHHPDEVTEREFKSGVRFINGDTLLARITPCLENGKTAFVDFLDDGEVGWGSTEYIILRSRLPLPMEFSYYLARLDDFRLHAIANMSGTSGRQRVPADCFDHFFIAVPSSELAAKFGESVRPAMSKVKANCLESKKLVALRDTLLPRLLSGKLRVPAMDSSELVE